jgi:hypothetical protein
VGFCHIGVSSRNEVVLRASDGKVLEVIEGFCNLASYGDIDGTVVVVPHDHSDEEYGATPVCCDFL